MLNEFSRSELLLGPEAMDRLKNSTVLVFGIGGVGSHCVEALARGGVGSLILVDNDNVSLTNINRQSIAYHSTIGMPKVDVMKKRILDINPEATVITYQTFVLPDNLDTIINDSIRLDYIVDAVDTVTAKLAIAASAESRRIPLISCMGTGNKLDPSKFEITDISKTSVCPLCKVMRRECKFRGIKKLKVLYSKEVPLTPSVSEEDSERRTIPGSVSFVPPVAGLMIAGEVIRELADPGSILGQVKP